MTRFTFGAADSGALWRAIQAVMDSLASTRGFFASDNLVAWGRSLSFLRDEPFMRAYRANAETPAERGIIWRTQTLVWAAHQALRLPEGDFVECGCYRGTSARIVYDATDLARTDRRLFLYDLFEGVGPDAVNPMPAHGPMLESEVRARFADAPPVIVTKGRVPECLSNAPEKIALLHIDMNSATAEVGALDVLFERVVPGGLVVLDDYGWLAYLEQGNAERSWFAHRGYRVLEMPTGQGLVVR